MISVSVSHLPHAAVVNIPSAYLFHENVIYIFPAASAGEHTHLFSPFIANECGQLKLL